MSKGGMKVEHPMGEGDQRHVIPHRGILHRGTVLLHGRLVDNIRLVVEEICAVDLQFGHNILLSFEPAIFYGTQSVSDRC